MPSIYEIRGTDGRAVYVGRAFNLDKRWEQHISAAVLGSTPVGVLMGSQGVENFSPHVVTECTSDDAPGLELAYIIAAMVRGDPIVNSHPFTSTNGYIRRSCLFFPWVREDWLKIQAMENVRGIRKIAAMWRRHKEAEEQTVCIFDPSRKAPEKADV